MIWSRAVLDGLAFVILDKLTEKMLKYNQLAASNQY